MCAVEEWSSSDLTAKIRKIDPNVVVKNMPEKALWRLLLCCESERENLKEAFLFQKRKREIMQLPVNTRDTHGHVVVEPNQDSAGIVDNSHSTREEEAQGDLEASFHFLPPTHFPMFHLACDQGALRNLPKQLDDIRREGRLHENKGALSIIVALCE